MLTARVTVDYT